jgi:hypothetical protein
VLGFTSKNCPGAKDDCKGLNVDWVDVEEKPSLAAKYHVGPLPAAVLVIDGKKAGHFEGRLGFAAKVKAWLTPGAEKPAAKKAVPARPLVPRVILRGCASGRCGGYSFSPPRPRCTGGCCYR